jgi:hypothetical protein
MPETLSKSFAPPETAPDAPPGALFPPESFGFMSLKDGMRYDNVIG